MIEFRTSSGLLVAIGYRRLVIGQRGAYIEFDDEHIEHDKLTVPEDQKYRFSREWLDRVFYFEYRTTDESYVKVYHQNQYVGYADYQPGLYYIAESDLEWGGSELSTEYIAKDNDDSEWFINEEE